MRRVLLAALAFLLAVSLVIAQGVALPGDGTPVRLKGVTLSGQISSNGKVLRADDDNDWTISNADAVKGFEGRYITVKCRMEPEKRAIRVLFIVEQPSTTRSANLGDSAFRR